MNDELSPKEMELLAGAQRRANAAKREWPLPERRIDRILAQRMPVQSQQGHSLPRWSKLGIGALAVLAFTAGLTSIKSVMTTKNAAPQTQNYSTAPAQLAKVKLADGSQVILAPSTKISVSGRNVYLTGEAVFTVVNHTKDPFTVHAGNSITKVLGTMFSVRAYRNENPQVIVAEGRVSVGNEVLGIGDVAVVDNNGTNAIAHNVNVTELIGWTEGKIRFNGLRFAELVPDLERWYDLDITVADKQVASRPLVGTFQNEDVEDVLRSLAITLDAKYERVGRKVTFSSK